MNKKNMALSDVTPITCRVWKPMYSFLKIRFRCAKHDLEGAQIHAGLQFAIRQTAAPAVAWNERGALCI